MLSAPHSATSDSDWRRDNPPSPPSNKGWFPGADPCSLPPPTPSDIRPYNASAHPPVNTGEHVGPAFGIGRELDLHGVGVVVDDFINMARIAAQRTTHENERLAAPAAGGGRRRIIAERIVPEQFVEAVFAVVGEDTMGRETFLAVTRLARVLDEIKTIEIDARADFRGRRPTLRPARGIDRLLAHPLACKDRKLLVLEKQHRRSETVCGHGLSSLDGLHDLLGGIIEIVRRQHIETGLANNLLAGIDIGAFKTHHQWHLEADFPNGCDHALGNDVALHDAAEDVDQNALHIGIGGDDLEGGRDLFLAGATA